jgi:hypothetical protein
VKKTRLRVQLTEPSVAQTIEEVKQYQEFLQSRMPVFLERLATVGAMVATRVFGAATYDGSKEAFVTVEPTQSGWAVRAAGHAVAFIEFGAGIYYNGSEPYPLDRPRGVKRIGEFGKGQGKRQGWVFVRDGEPVFTHGTPAAMPMYHAVEEIRQAVGEVAQEVFAYG